MLAHVEQNAWDFIIRPIRIESAKKAVDFFQKRGYVLIGDPYECLCAGGGLFRILQTMEKEGENENWDS